MAVPHAPMRETAPPTQQYNCANPIIAENLSLYKGVCVCVCGVGFLSRTAFCLLRWDSLRGPGKEVPPPGPHPPKQKNRKIKEEYTP